MTENWRIYNIQYNIHKTHIVHYFMQKKYQLTLTLFNNRRWHVLFSLYQTVTLNPTCATIGHFTNSVQNSFFLKSLFSPVVFEDISEAVPPSFTINFCFMQLRTDPLPPFSLIISFSEKGSTLHSKIKHFLVGIQILVSLPHSVTFPSIIWEFFDHLLVLVFYFEFKPYDDCIKL